LPLIGAARITSTFGGPASGITITEFEIKSAARVTEEKMKYVSVAVGSNNSKTTLEIKVDLRPTETVLLKSTAKIRVIDSRTADGSEISVQEGMWINPPIGRPPATQFLEKCLD
jgi:hypothetical protein